MPKVMVQVHLESVNSSLLPMRMSQTATGESTLHPNKTAFLDLEVGAEGDAGFRCCFTVFTRSLNMK